MTDAAERATVLVADDEASVLSLATAALRRRGYGVRSAVDGQEAFEIFKEHPEDIGLLLTDLKMPRKSGFELIRDVQAIKPEQAVVAMSADLHEWNQDLTEIPTLSKPFDIKTLLKAVEQGLKAGSSNSIPSCEGQYEE